MTNTNRYSPVCRKGIFLYDSFSPFIRHLTRFAVFAMLAVACRQKTASNGHASAYQGEPLFKDTIRINHSKGFTLQYFSNYKLLKILNQFADKADTLTYVLVQRGTPVPAGFSAAQVIQVPVQKMVITSSMHVGMLDYLGAVDVISGLSEFKYISSPAVRKKVAAGKVAEVGNGSTLNDELLISMHPGLVMTMGSPTAKFSRYKNLINTGIPVLINSEWLETDPLGRSEWVKMMAALLNKEALVNRKFAQVEQEYNRLKELAAHVSAKPSVVIGMPFKGSWFVPDGDSYTTRFLQDAGASYKWSDTKGTGSLALDFETVAPVALGADFWLNTGDVNSREDITARDVRYTQFRPFKQGTVFNNNKRLNDIGANDYWESGSVQPQTILADLIRILHPELLPAHELVYYKQIK